MAVMRLALVTLVTIAIGLLTFGGYRLSRMHIIHPGRRKHVRRKRGDKQKPTHLLIVLGSGGHTAEMIAMLFRAITDPDPTKRLDWTNYTHRTWVVSSGDNISAQRAKTFEEKTVRFAEEVITGKTQNDKTRRGTYDICTVPRAREIHQPIHTAPISSLRCMKACYEVLTKRTVEEKDGETGTTTTKVDLPDLILCNGPATATILIFTTILLRLFDFGGADSRGKMRTVYVESWARVKKLSLSGTLLSRVVDRFLVQWPQLEKVNERLEYRGVLV
ncbi:Hypothetical protein R9X50_00662200 [Acrodontium crateriforme]|uniref:UDP-N-acetylglucosamine transferase subunit ALG14 n=1 Tax=Acrodontium crateriforme TaxID=150365 RepID=A0AAQ3M8N7_9PEZI|nr:Hypothetical protein R9X50_00662200 [Acrodontium crateriforme]